MVYLFIPFGKFGRILVRLIWNLWPQFNYFFQ